MAEAYIVEACRTPVGKRGGSLSQVHPADLGAFILKALIERSGVDPNTVDDVIFGCIDQIGPQAGDIARTAWLAAGFSEDVPGVTIDRQCGSSQQAVHFAAQAVMSGTMDVVVAGGVQNMSLIPIGTAGKAGKEMGLPGAFHGSEGWVRRYNTEPVSQFYGAEKIAEKWNISREDMEQFALESHRRARQAQAEGRFDREIVPFGDFAVDEGPRDTTLEKMASLPLLPGAKTLTAAVSSPTNDAATAVLIANEAAVKRNGWTPRARIHFLGVRGADPIYMLTAPINATAFALDKTGLSLDDIDLVEINEAFAPVVLAWQKETGADLARVNVNGGAIALGHPIGATGTRLMTTLLHELERTGGRYGLQTMCEGGGQANVTIIERL
ncbi:MAG: acetyl-CoA C-acetyltransferase [Actinobacteria bacterium]|nr:MAG: acetyl-CoA C-acetyltransferase [Actinomycetota bacterium]